MNKARREELFDVVELLDEAVDRLNEIRDDEQAAFDNLTEGLQMERIAVANIHKNYYFFHESITFTTFG